MATSGDLVKAQIGPDPSDDPAQPWETAALLREVAGTAYRLPDVTFTSVATIDLGDRYVELVHPGRGHTDGDLVVVVPESGVLFAGDLVEESGPPSYGGDCFPMEWPATLDLVVGMLAEQTVVVPGHGAAVDRSFVEQQRISIADVAEQIRQAHASGVSAGEALASNNLDWPYPPKLLADAVHRGYAHLSASA